MARRPSTVSLSSVGSGTGLQRLSQLPPIPGPSSRSVSTKSLPNGSPSISRSVSMATQPDYGKGNENWDPDELFIKHTVNEVKQIQQRLRADADAKKEELRLMVGERYRDLLQASTSIISIAESSGRVVNALGEMRNITSSIQIVESPKTSGGGQGDNSLPTLQSLAAHLKLLLDSPEHLWRLLERKSYLFAAWLFLLSRVVHRSLLQTGDDDEALDWESLGIDITEQFPLVQRQWDAISQFRSQITHKATLSLREPNLSPTDVCAVMLALHLLESKPFPETLSSFLAQRSKSLSAALARPKERPANGSALEEPSTDAKKPKSAIREVRRKLKVVLDIVCKTLAASRAVLLQGPQNQAPLMLRVLRHIQDEDPGSEAELPTELRLTSQSLLATLPSSNHFLLLPSSIKAYKPYVEEASLSPPEKQAQIARRLTEWSRTALQNIQTTMASWFAELTSIRELWQLRAWCRKWLEKSQGLEDEERALIHSSVDSICRQKAVELWKAALDSAKEAFREHLENALASLGQAESHSYDIEPARYLLRAPPLPSASQLASTSSSAPFHTYTSNLRLQISGRTPLSQEVLESVEATLHSLRDELGAMTGDDEDTSHLASELVELYRADSESLCDTMCDCLRSTVDRLDPAIESEMHALVLVGRLSLELSTTAHYVTSIGCTQVVADDLRGRLRRVHSDAATKWQQFVVIRTLSPYLTSLQTTAEGSPKRDLVKPSSSLVVALQSLSATIPQSGVLPDLAVSNDRARSILRAFAHAYLQKLDEEPIPPGNAAQAVYDLALLHAILTSWGSEAEETATRVLAAAERLDNEAGDVSRFQESANAYLIRVRMLLGMLLPPSTDKEHLPGVAKHVTSTDAQHQSSLELVKPSARFGLLLVGSSASR